MSSSRRPTAETMTMISFHSLSFATDKSWFRHRKKLGLSMKKADFVTGKSWLCHRQSWFRHLSTRMVTVGLRSRHDKLFHELKCYLSEHGFPMVRHHGTVVAVEGDACVVEWFLGLSHGVIQFWDTALIYTAKVARYQCPAYSWNMKKNMY